jgi:uncharacterized protein
MPAASLLALIDDIAALLDDVAVLSKVAAQKTAGVMGDDLALNAEQVAGVSTDRELPVVWAVAKGSLLNKLILVPAALAISAFLPVAILPLLMIGGLFLCYEGFEKIWHKFVHSTADDAAEAHDRAERLRAVADPSIDPVALERTKIKGAIRTDFILSAEIVVIALGTMASQPIAKQVLSLSLVALGVTVLVYGIVAGIVKIDDLGLTLTRSADVSRRALGAWLLRTAPLLMKALSILGTAAMFMVGGSIIVHGVPALEHALHSVTAAAAARSGVIGFIATSAVDGLVGVVAGGVAVAALTIGRKLLGRG